MARGQTLIAGAAIAALLLWARSAKARTSSTATPGADITFPPADQWYPAPEGWQPSADYFDPVYGDAWSGDEQLPEVASEGDYEPLLGSELDLLGVGLPMGESYHGAGGPLDMGNLDAFLVMIRRAEHYPVDVVSGNDYRTFYGGTKFTNLSDHPVITGELQPVKLPAEMCRRAGYASGNCVTTAAGAYQMTRPTWQRIRSSGTYLADFSAASQDEAARRLLAELGVPGLLSSGDFAAAVRKAAKLWASLPGSTAGQGGKSLAQVTQFYRDAGGAIA